MRPRTGLPNGGDGMTTFSGGAFYEKLGVRPFINLAGSLTDYGGFTLSPAGDGTILVRPFNMNDGEETIAAERLRQILRG